MTATSPTPLYIDVTDTLARDGGTGIQRVVRQFVRWMPDEAVARGREVRLVAAVDGRFRLVSTAGLQRLAHAARLPAAPSNTPVTAPAATAAGAGVNGWGAVALLHRVPALLSAVQRWNLNRRVRGWLDGLVEPEAVAFGQSDVLLLLDSHWGGTTAVAAARRARREGARVVTVVYDLIPLSHPRDALPLLALTFGRRIRAALSISVGCLTISRFCADGIGAMLAAERWPLPVAHFHLGADASPAFAPSGSPEPGFPPPTSLGLTSGTPSFVMIGSVEPHKGHAVVLDAFERRWLAGMEGELVIVGRRGRGDPALTARLDQHPERGGRLRLVHDADDAAVAAILARATATIMASRIEGFGLPIVESLHAGVPVIASDIPVFREIGGMAVCFFRLDDPDSLFAAIARVEQDQAVWRARAAAFAWIGWQESAYQALDALDTVLAAQGSKS